MGVGAGIFGAFLASCSQQGSQASSASVPKQEDKTIALKPESGTWKVGLLVGEFQKPRVDERVEQGTGKIVDPPMLRATVKLTNTSSDQTVRIMSGKVEYLGPDGKAIPLSEQRRDTSFTFNAYQSESLDPGKETSTQIEVPFPTAALANNELRSIRVDLKYTALPFRDEHVDVPTTVGG